MKEQETTNHKPQTVSYNLNINLLPNVTKLQRYVPLYANRNVKGLIKFYVDCKAFAKSGKVLNAKSIAGWGSACSGLVVFTNTV
jgi:hypothetical protein